MNTQQLNIVGLVCLCLCVYSLPILGNGSLKNFPEQRRIFDSVVFYMVRDLLKESRPLFIPRTSCFATCHIMKY
jgi:hypothetical protein